MRIESYEKGKETGGFVSDVDNGSGIGGQGENCVQRKAETTDSASNHDVLDGCRDGGINGAGGEEGECDVGETT